MHVRPIAIVWFCGVLPATHWCGALTPGYENKLGLRVTSISQVLSISDDSEIDLGTAALIVSEEWSGVVQGYRYRDLLDQMVKEVETRCREKQVTDPFRKTAALNDYLYKEMRFQTVPNADDPNDLFLHCVLDNRRGYCLSLSVLYLSLGERLGLPLYGVVVPGHFFVRYDSGTIRFNIEATAAGRSLTDEHYTQTHKVPSDSAFYLKNLTKKQTLACMFNNFGTAFKQIRESDKALRALDLSASIMPGLAEARTNMAGIYLERRQLPEALAQAQAALQANPSDASVYHVLGQVYLGQEMTQQALSSLSRAIELDPTLAEACADLAMVFAKQTQFARAKDTIRQAIELKYNSPLLYLKAGDIWQETGDLDTAVSYYRKAVGIDPGYCAAHFALGLVYTKQDQCDQAIAAYKQVLAIDPLSYPALLNLAYLHVKKKDFSQAVVAYTKALSLDGTDPKVHHNLACAYTELRQFDQAAAHLKKAIELNPKMGQSHYMLAVAYYTSGNVQKAWDHLVLAKQWGVDVPKEQFDQFAARAGKGAQP